MMLELSLDKKFIDLESILSNVGTQKIKRISVVIKLKSNRIMFQKD